MAVGTINYFDVATSIARAHESKRQKQLCECGAYPFKHRKYGGRCEGEQQDEDTGGRTLAEINGEMLALHDATEARAINRSKWI